MRSSKIPLRRLFSGVPHQAACSRWFCGEPIPVVVNNPPFRPPRPSPPPRPHSINQPPPKPTHPLPKNQPPTAFPLSELFDDRHACQRACESSEWNPRRQPGPKMTNSSTKYGCSHGLLWIRPQVWATQRKNEPLLIDAFRSCRAGRPSGCSGRPAALALGPPRARCEHVAPGGCPLN